MNTKTEPANVIPPVPRPKTEELLQAADQMDWQQVALNGGPPCFHFENGKFCGRAERWPGHEVKTREAWSLHSFVSLAKLLGRFPVAAPSATPQGPCNPDSDPTGACLAEDDLVCPVHGTTRRAERE